MLPGQQPGGQEGKTRGPGGVAGRGRFPRRQLPAAGRGGASWPNSTSPAVLLGH